MRTYALLVSILIALAATTYGDIAIDVPNYGGFDPGSPGYPGVSLPLASMGSASSLLSAGSLSTMSVVRIIHVTVDPAWPSPSDPVSVTISTQASDPYLVVDGTTVNRQGDDVVIDLYWSSNPPPPSPPATSSRWISRQWSLGYGIEQISTTPSAIQADNKYEVTEPLGTFSPGVYNLRVYSHGALEGEAAATFRVRDPSPSAGNLIRELLPNLWFDRQPASILPDLVIVVP
jgi:hypothetical protein